MSAPSRRPCFVAILLTAVLAGCSGDDSEPSEFLFTFEESTQNWSGDITDFAPGQGDTIGFTFERRALPSDVEVSGQGLFVEGRNVSDSLFMYLLHPVSGLKADTSYAATFEVMLASNAPSGCAGIGGAPGESVYLKAGASRVQPESSQDENGIWRLNIDKGGQSSGGSNARVLGNIANGVEDCLATPYRLITRDNFGDPLLVTSDDQGQLWLLVGTDSGFEGTTALYYDTIRVVLDPR